MGAGPLWFVNHNDSAQSSLQRNPLFRSYL
jgi:hypothetical protein